LKLKEIYKLAIKKGIEVDPRGKKEIERLLKREKEEFSELKEEEKWEFDQDRLFNPFSDTRILYGDNNKEIKGILVGIDLGVGEVLLADRLKERGKRIDLLISHHPSGKALAALHRVMGVQADIWHKYGVPINVAEGVLSERIKEVQRAFMPVNHTQTLDAAKLLGLPLMCVHTAADNLVTNFLQDVFDQKKPETVKEVIDILKKIPEHKEAVGNNAGPTIFQGNKENRAGKIVVDMTGGTSGPKEVMEKLSAAGVGTLVGMHIKEESCKQAKKYHIYIVIAGHMASDSLGLNLFLDELEKRGVEIIPCSGLIRIRRMKVS